MFTPAVLARVVLSDDVQDAPVCVIWRRDQAGCWDYVCRAPDFDVERIIWLDVFQSGTTQDDYKVTQG
jgi:hypothetical protein